jgi:RNA polymerase sigma-70 factor (ECF subfamily)
MFTQNALVSETPRLNKFALRLTRNKSDADDLLQSTCLRALEKVDCFEDGTNLFGWTSKIMFNLFVSGYRRRTKHEVCFDPESHLENISVCATQELGAELVNVKRALLQLTSDHRRILVMICVNGLRYEEVAQTLKIPVGTVRSRLSRARRQMQVILGTTDQQFA